MTSDYLTYQAPIGAPRPPDLTFSSSKREISSFLTSLIASLDQNPDPQARLNPRI